MVGVGAGGGVGLGVGVDVGICGMGCGGPIALPPEQEARPIALRIAQMKMDRTALIFVVY